MKKIQKIAGIYRVIVNILAICGALIVIFMMVSISIGVVTRFFFHRSLVWLTEICGYGMVFMTFLVAAWVLREEGHVRIDLLADRLNPRHKAILEFFTCIVGSLVCLVITVYGVLVAWDHMKRGVFTATDLEIPWAPLLAVIPVGTFALSVQFLIRAWGHLKKEFTGTSHRIT